MTQDSNKNQISAHLYELIHNIESLLSSQFHSSPEHNQPYVSTHKGANTVSNPPLGVDVGLYQQVVSIVAKRTSRKKIEPTSRLYHDLGLDGINAYDLMVDLQNQLGVDMTNFVFHIHFQIEDVITSPVERIYRLLTEDLSASRRTPKAPITIIDLYDAAQAKTWPNLNDRIGK